MMNIKVRSSSVPRFGKSAPSSLSFGTWVNTALNPCDIAERRATWGSASSA
jgi:hypothetical protein